MDAQNKNLAGRSAFITGAARGIGHGIAEKLGRAGATVAILDLRQERVDQAVHELARAGIDAIGFAGDIGKPGVLSDAIDRFAERQGRLDMLVNNAMWVKYEPLTEVSTETMDRMLDTGFRAVVWGMQAAARHMIPVRRGAILNIGSITGTRSMPASLMYSGVKAAVDGLTRGAAVDLGPYAIRVNAIAPGTTLTEGVARNLPPEILAQRLSRVPLGRLADVGDIASAASFLLGDDSGWISGTTLYVDGATTAAHM